MAARPFYNTNANRSFPFVRGTVDQTGSGTLSGLPDAAIADAGFIMGARSLFDSATHTVYLARIRRSSDTFYFDFASSAPELFEIELTFTRHVGDPDYAVEFLDTGHTGVSNSSQSDSEGPCSEPLYSGCLLYTSDAADE